MKAPLRNWLTIGSTAVLIGAILILVSGYSGIRRLENGAEWADHAFRVIQGFQKIQLDLKQVEVDYTRYLLTRDAQILGPLDREMGQVDQDSLKLRGTPQEEPLAAARLGQPQGLVGGRILAVGEGLRWA